MPAALLAISLGATACTGTHAADTGTSGPQLKTLGGDGTAGRVLAVADRVPAPVIRGETLDGDPLDVSALQGKVVVLNFWASWCSPCRAESASLVQVAKDFAGKGVAFVGVDIKDERGPAKRFVQVHDVPYPSLFDQSGVLLTRFVKYVPQSPPTTLLLDRQGRIAAMFPGGLTQSELAAPVAQLAAEWA
jgi:thiol-disulfide isomerase/thioredoxin